MTKRVGSRTASRMPAEDSARTPPQMMYHSTNYAKHVHPSVLYQMSTARMLKVLYSSLLKTGARDILEIGCGEGFVLDYLAKRRPNLHLDGLDSDAQAIAMAERIAARQIRFHVGDGRATAFDDRSFDIVVLSEVLEHVRNPNAMLVEALRLSRKGVLVTVPREPWFRLLAALIVGAGLADDPQHVNFWSPRKLRLWLSEHAVLREHRICDLYQIAHVERCA